MIVRPRSLVSFTKSRLAPSKVMFGCILSFLEKVNWINFDFFRFNFISWSLANRLMLSSRVCKVSWLVTLLGVHSAIDRSSTNFNLASDSVMLVVVGSLPRGYQLFQVQL